MKQIILIFFIILSFNPLSWGNSCAPVYPTKLVRLNCTESMLFYSITINTWRSHPKNMCTGNRYEEYSTALVQIADAEENALLPDLTVINGEFIYNLGAVDGNASFASAKYNLYLYDCAYAEPAGASIGN